jgi:hypothetical protein
MLAAPPGMTTNLYAASTSPGEAVHSYQQNRRKSGTVGVDPEERVIPDWQVFFITVLSPFREPTREGLTDLNSIVAFNVQRAVIY